MPPSPSQPDRKAVESVPALRGRRHLRGLGAGGGAHRTRRPARVAASRPGCAGRRGGRQPVPAPLRQPALEVVNRAIAQSGEDDNRIAALAAEPVGAVDDDGLVERDLPSCRACSCPRAPNEGRRAMGAPHTTGRTQWRDGGRTTEISIKIKPPTPRSTRAEPPATHGSCSSSGLATLLFVVRGYSSVKNSGGLPRLSVLADARGVDGATRGCLALMLHCHDARKRWTRSMLAA